MYYNKETIWIESLNRYAKLYVGLPDNYEDSDQVYPVLYMHDGHNLFDPNDSYTGKTWEVLKAYETFHDLPNIIIVGLECANGVERLNEYGPFPFTYDGFEFSKRPGGKADQYLEFLVNELKPMIDKKCRTNRDQENTGIMGSSMGGVVSLYAAVKYPDVFGRIGSVSGAFYVSIEPIINALKEAELSNVVKLYMDTGTDEIGGGNEKDYITSNDDVYNVLKEQLPKERLTYKIIKGGKHSEHDWAKRFPDILRELWK